MSNLSLENENTLKRVGNDLCSADFRSFFLVTDDGKGNNSVLANGEVSPTKVFAGALQIAKYSPLVNVQQETNGLNEKQKLFLAAVLGLDISPREMAEAAKYLELRHN